MAATIPAFAFLSNPASSSSSSSHYPAAAYARAFRGTVFLGSSKFQAAIAKPSLGVACPPSKRLPRIHCQRQEQQKKLPVIPREQRWMYEESEINGPDIWNKTWYPKAADCLAVNKTWYIVDATDKILGRLASTIAIHIRGKHLPTFTPSMDMGSYVIVVNAEKVEVTGNKRTQKIYRRHSGRPGGMKEETFDRLQRRIPERIIEHAVRGMLPKGRLGRRLFTHLKVYKGPDHPHEAQKPIPLPLRDKRIQMVKKE